MGELLKRWAELEPERCKHEVLAGNNWISVWLNEWTIVYSDSPFASIGENGQEMRIQWAVQEAITSRGWPLGLEWDGEWLAKVKNNLCSHDDLNNPAAALLGAYLKALEANRDN